MEIIDNKVVKFKVKNPDRITSVIPKSQWMGEVAPGVHEVLVHFGLDEAHVMKNLKLKGVRSPIAFKYNWPGMFTPFAHQKDTAEFLTLHKRCYCLNEAGTGKTGAALWAADYLLSIKKIKRVLVVCPVSIMRSAWVADAFKCVMHRAIAVAHGTKDQRLVAINGDAEFVVINYDGIATVQKELAGKFDLIILDEATFIKTASTRRWKSLGSIVTHETWLWLMTGTPAAQTPLDAYGLAKMCTPARVPAYFGAWRDATMVKLGLFRWGPSRNATTLVNNALQPAIRFTKEECLDLPEMLYQTRDVPMSKQQEKYYKMLRTKLTFEAAGDTITAVHAAAALNKLLQISAGAVYTDTGEILKFDAKDRLDELLCVIRESSHKTVVFVPFRHAIEVTRSFLVAEGLTVECIFGDVPVNKRTEIFKRFQETDDPQVLVIQPQSAAHGVTLTAASTIVWFGPTYSLETYLQGNARIHRAGQKNKTLVVRLCGSPVEKAVYAALDAKGLDQSKLMQLYDDVIKGA
jgi:SNF2 family DNA or RNA helicase